MELTLLGTAGPRGWPDPECGCASCAGVRGSGAVRAPTRVVVDDLFSLDAARVPPGYRRRVLPDTSTAYDLTGPDGGRALVAAGPDALPEAARRRAAARGPYDLVLLDLLAAPTQLGDLRRRGAVAAGTDVLAVHVDHRVTSTRELQRRLGMWGARLVPDGSAVSTASRPCAPTRDLPRRSLVLGGASSGKSAEAELRLAGEPAVTYVAAGGGDAAGDPEWQAKVAAHRARRPPWWHTVETSDVAAVVAAAEDAVLVDGLGTWLAAVMTDCGAWDAAPDRVSGDAALRRVRARVEELLDACRRTRARLVAVSDEVGGGVVPDTASGRRFRDELGTLNQLVAAESEDVVLTVAGRTIVLPR